MISTNSARTANLLVAMTLALSLLIEGPAWAVDGHAGSSGEAGGTPFARVTQPPNSLPGIDVSHWQNTIDWTKVASSGVRFAFMKASEGQNYVDPLYATNRAEANANGVTIGAYHFAKPDGSANDAILEADHFVDTALPAPGDLLPVLDIERSGGLSPARLTQWILDWLGEVTSRTGVRPIVYTSPLGWADRTGDTTAVADAGYTVLWVAHWNVPSPMLPANDWQGYGWTFWQYGDCGHIPGIGGCTDVDWFNGLAFDAVTIPYPDQTPPVATITSPTDVLGQVSIAFDEVVSGVDAQNVVLRTTDTQADVPATRSCVGPMGNGSDCSTGKVISVSLLPNDPLVPGQTYAAIVNPAGSSPLVSDPSFNPAATTEQDFTAPTQVEQGSPAVHLSWRAVSNPGAYGGSFAVEHLAGASATYSFAGRQITWFTVAGPVFGRAAVSIDGHAKGTFNGYSAQYAYKVAHTFRGLAPGPHTITITSLGQRGSTRATDSRVAVDAFTSGGKTVWTPSLAATWHRAHVAGASGGSVAVDDLAGASATFTFRGIGVQWSDARGPSKGKAEIYVDGALVRIVDDFAAAASVTTRSITGLADGVHTLRIVVLGVGRPAAKGSEIAIDRFAVIA